MRPVCCGRASVTIFRRKMGQCANSMRNNKQREQALEDEDRKNPTDYIPPATSVGAAAEAAATAAEAAAQRKEEEDTQRELMSKYGEDRDRFEARVDAAHKMAEAYEKKPDAFTPRGTPVENFTPRGTPVEVEGQALEALLKTLFSECNEVVDNDDTTLTDIEIAPLVELMYNYKISHTHKPAHYSNPQPAVLRRDLFLCSAGSIDALTLQRYMVITLLRQQKM